MGLDASCSCEGIHNGAGAERHGLATQLKIKHQKKHVELAQKPLRLSCWACPKKKKKKNSQGSISKASVQGKLGPSTINHKNVSLICFNHRPRRKDQWINTHWSSNFLGRVDLQDKWSICSVQLTMFCSCRFMSFLPLILHQSHMANLKRTECKCPGGIDMFVFLSDCKRTHVSHKQAPIIFRRLTNVPELITLIAALQVWSPKHGLDNLHVGTCWHD